MGGEHLLIGPPPIVSIAATHPACDHERPKDQQFSFIHDSQALYSPYEGLLTGFYRAQNGELPLNPPPFLLELASGLGTMALFSPRPLLYQ